ncbi:hypothetical protein [Bradyrhizobium sp.]|uniref:hypothetical protein n=1 Tax=Bradyrhizobium sp. TaxID=376 RepID=UPI002D80FB9A|nr:hypothetical protein [Bradyrhizobium sp.]
MRIDAGDSGGETQIGCSDRLTLAEQIAVRCAGGIAQAIFECPGNEVATFKDNFEVMKLLEVHGYTESKAAPWPCAVRVAKLLKRYWKPIARRR